MKTLVKLLILFYCCNLNAQTVKKMKHKTHIEDFNFKNYIDKPLYYLLTNDSIRKYEKWVFENKKPGVLLGLIIKLKDNIEIVITFNELEFTNRFKENLDWDFQTVIQEKITTVEIYLNGYKTKIIE